ncbi:MAG: helix-turn-helix transcriptional regulator [Eubacterium sp.]|nr:helix-turn-helix transcriptional regulator [Eubacterium sp.]
MFKEDFYKRLTELRVKEDVSAREMSLSIGKNPGYIFEVERGNSMPSMETFFFICDYLHITPKQFFDTNIDNPMELNEAVKLIKMLNPDQLSHILEVIKDVLQIPKFKR